MNPDAPDTVSLADVLEATGPNDRYDVYRRLREDNPVRWDPQWSVWVVTGYHECAAALHDDRITASRFLMGADWLPPEAWERITPVLAALQRQMLFVDGKDHARLRSLANKAFTPRVVEGMRTGIQDLVDRLLARPGKAGGMDVVRDIAHPLPVTVIGQLLGVPEVDHPRLKHWSDDFAAFLDGSSLTPETTIQSLLSIAEFMDYFRALTLGRRAAPHADLLQALVDAELDGDRLSEDELLANCVLLLAAGHETTTNLIANGLHALLTHPDQLDALRADPALITSAVNELLRFESPVQNTERRAERAVELGGIQIAADQALLIILGAANRDPAVFADPDRLLIGRSGPQHLAFGYGAHFCLGAALARLEGQIAIGTVVRRFPNIRLVDRIPRWKRSLLFRSLETLPVHVS
ncbi:MAG: cytochrome P450 [Chloroflexota bacterium]